MLTPRWMLRFTAVEAVMAWVETHEEASEPDERKAITDTALQALSVFILLNGQPVRSKGIHGPGSTDTRTATLWQETSHRIAQEWIETKIDDQKMLVALLGSLWAYRQTFTPSEQVPTDVHDLVQQRCTYGVVDPQMMGGGRDAQ